MNVEKSLYIVKPELKTDKKIYIDLQDIEKSIEDNATYYEFFEMNDNLKFYFDFDKKVDSKEEYDKYYKLYSITYYNDIKKKFNDYFRKLKNEIIIDIAISSASYYKNNEENKLSFHYVVLGVSTSLIAMKHIILDIDKKFFNNYEGVDKSIYRATGKTGNMRLIYSSKYKSTKRQLIPINYKDDIKKHIIQDIYDGQSDIHNFIIYKDANDLEQQRIAFELTKNPNKKIYQLDEFEKQCLHLIDYDNTQAWKTIAAILKSIGCSFATFRRWSDLSTKFNLKENMQLWANCKYANVSIGSLYYFANHPEIGNPIQYKELKEKYRKNRHIKKDNKLYKYSIPECYINELIKDLDIDKDAPIDDIINASNYKDKESIINYYRYKPILENEIEPEIKVHQRYLDTIDNNGECVENFIEKYAPNNKLVVLKSDTGSGKTTSIFNYFENNENQSTKFLSITSRVCLAEAHYKAMLKKGKRCRIYNKGQVAKGDNIIVQIDSIISKLNFTEFDNYIVYIDEFASLLEYLHCSSTLNKTRVLVYKKLIKILKECKKAIFVDADIDDICINWLQYINNDLIYIENTHINNNAVPSLELHNYEAVLDCLGEELKKDGFCCPCDSKNVACDVYEQLCQRYPEHKDKIKCITDEHKGYIDMDSIFAIIYSPKVIYGLDAQKQRPVYCIYKEHTISPKAMYQQISRTRHITKLYYYFNKKIFNYSWFNNLEEVAEEFNAIEKYTNELAYFIDEEKSIASLYKRTLQKYVYNNDAYATNKFCHSLLIFNNKGIIIDDIIKKNNKQVFLAYQKAYRELKKENFTPDNYFVKEQNKKYMKMTRNEVIEYQDYFLNPHKLDAHFLYCKYFIKEKDNFLAGLNKLKDFNINKATNTKVKLYFLHKVQQYFNLQRNEFVINENDNYNITYAECKELDKEYKIIFRATCKASFTNNSGVNLILPRMFKAIFGTDFFTAKRVLKLGKKITEYKINDALAEEHKKIYNIRTNLYIDRREQEIKTKKAIFDFIDEDFIIDNNEEKEGNVLNELDIDL